jgi:hypothetical protein
MGTIISETAAKLSKEVDKDIGVFVGDRIDQPTEEILNALSEESHVYLGEEDD